MTTLHAQARRISVRVSAAAVLLTMLGASAPALAHDNVVVHRGMGEESVRRLNNPFLLPYLTEVGEGSYAEDVPATRSLGHFYNPETDSAPWFALGSGPAWQNSQDQFNAALIEYNNNNLVGTDAAFHRMGRALHFIQDMTSPAHVHDDQHATDDEDFEGWGPNHFFDYDYSAVAPKYAAVLTAEGFVKEIARLAYDMTLYQVDIDEDEGAQPASEYKDMFPSLHWEDGGFWGDDVWEVDRIGTFDCYGNGVFCNDGWWVVDENMVEDNSGRGGARRLRGFAYVENTGGNSAEPVPVVFKAVPNTAAETMLRLYGRLLYPEAVAYGAGLLQVFADAVGAPPVPTATATAAMTATPSATATPTEEGPPVPTATPTVSGVPSATPTPVPPSATPTPTATATPPGLCGPTPRSDCRGSIAAEKGSIFVRDRSGTLGDHFKWKWSKGTATTVADFGDPLTATNYAVCVYDTTAGVEALRMTLRIPASGDCGGRLCWRAIGDDGFKYSDAALTPDGVHKVLMRAGTAGRARLQVSARGPVLGLPPQTNGSIFAQDPRVVVQLVNDLPGGACWESRFSSPATRNSFEQFKDKSD